MDTGTLATGNLIPSAEIPNDALDSCDHIAYQFTGLIQSHVTFLNIDRSDFRILNTSENSASILGIEIQAILGQRFDSSLLSGVDALRRRTEGSHPTERFPIVDDSLVNRHGECLLTRIQANLLYFESAISNARSDLVDCSSTTAEKLLSWNRH